MKNKEKVLYCATQIKRLAEQLQENANISLEDKAFLELKDFKTDLKFALRNISFLADLSCSELDTPEIQEEIK